MAAGGGGGAAGGAAGGAVIIQKQDKCFSRFYFPMMPPHGLSVESILSTFRWSLGFRLRLQRDLRLRNHLHDAVLDPLHHAGNGSDITLC